jgi:hypothetical protein
MRWLAIACGAAAVVLWTLFAKVSRMIGVCPPVLAGLRDGLGILFFAMAALGSLCVSLAVALSARKSKSWGTEGNCVFWGGAFLTVVFLVSALQFIVVGRWHAVHPVAYLVIKWVLLVWVLTYLIWTLVYSRRARR